MTKLAASKKRVKSRTMNVYYFTLEICLFFVLQHLFFDGSIKSG